MAATERLTPQILRKAADLDATATLPMAPARLRLARAKSRRQGDEFSAPRLASLRSLVEFDSEEFYATNVIPYDGDPRPVAETTGLQQLRSRTRRLRGLVVLILTPLTLLAAFNIGRATAPSSPPAAALVKEATPTITQASLPVSSSPALAPAPAPTAPPSAVLIGTPTSAPTPVLAPKPVRRRRAPVRVPATREPAPAAESSSLPTTRENPSDGILNAD